MTGVLIGQHSLVHRVLRSSMITVMGFGLSQVIRLALNVALSRLLFPEAFGMMALVMVVLTGVTMLSDIGTGTAILQSKRGDDPAFLDTAWTLQIVRAFILWFVVLAIAPVVARFYEEPQLRWFLSVAAIGIIIGGFTPTRLQTANRHLNIGLVTVIDIVTQLISALVAILLAWALQSIWALVIMLLVSACVNLTLQHTLLPGHRNRLRYDRSAIYELVHFGKWIFLATITGFIANQADRVVLGRYLDLEEFGIYSIGHGLASLPLFLGMAVGGRVLIPMYRDSQPTASRSNARHIRRFRTGALVILLALSAIFAFGADHIVQLIYDHRYYPAADVIVLVAIMQAPAILLLTCDQAMLAVGDSRNFFWQTLLRAVLVAVGILLGVHIAGLGGAIIGQGLGILGAYPMVAWALRRHGALDLALDLPFLATALVVGGVALWLRPITLL